MTYKINLIKARNAQTIPKETFPKLVETDSNKVKFIDGKREYQNSEKAHNALRGFRKFQTKRNNATWLIHRMSYDEFEKKNLTDEEKKTSNK